MLSKDIEYVNKMFKKRSGIRNDLIYKFTTENISGYIKEFNLKNRSLHPIILISIFLGNGSGCG